MKELTVEDIKKISIEILRDVHNFCVENNLRYSLAYGTLLGAVRHHGFIPWDDDIDIMMPRPDYDKFIHSYKSKNSFAVFSPELKNSYIAFARVSEVVKTYVHAEANWAPKEGGIWIDIFPIDGLEEDYNTIQDKTAELKDFNGMVYERRTWLTVNNNLLIKIKQIKHRLFDFLNGKSIWTLLDRMEVLRKEMGYKSHKRGIYDIVYKKTAVFSADIFDHYTTLTFEDNNYMVIEAYDTYLKQVYGDYMKLPPVEERVLRHSTHKYYWKD